MSERHQSENEVCEEIRQVINDTINKVRKLEANSVGATHIYRGESEYHDKVSSGLYRAYAKLELRDFDPPGTEDSDASRLRNSAILVERSQNLVAKRAKRYLPEMAKDEDSEILAKLQHYGGKTNLIDFTADFLVALFFACEGADHMDGRIILLERKPVNTRQDNCYEVREPLRTIARAESQKSVLVRAPKGFLETDQYKEIRIDRSLKKAIRDYLERYHGICAERIYSDIHGFIRLQNIYLPGYREFAQGKLYEEKGDEILAMLESEPRPAQEKVDSLAEQKQAAYDTALEHYTEASRRVNGFWDAYISRVRVHLQKEDYDNAINVCTEAIEQNPSGMTLAAIHTNRGEVRSLNDDIEGAIEDFTRAIELLPEDQQDFPYFRRALLQGRAEEWASARADLETAQNRGANLRVLFNQKIRDFEKRYGVELPADIAEMLTAEGTQKED